MNWRIVSHLNTRKIKELQNRKLRAFIKYQICYHPYYGELFKKSKIRLDSIKTTDDLVKIPFTIKEDLVATKKEPKKYTDFILQPDKELIKRHYNKIRLIRSWLLNIFNKDYLKNNLEKEYKPIHIHFTTGRSALSIPFFYSTYDINKLKEAGRRMFDVFNVKPDSTVINGFPYSPHLAFWQTCFAIIANNMLSLQTGGGKILGSEKTIKAVENMKANVLVFTPGYAYHLIRKAAEEKKNFSSVSEIIFGGERIPAGLRVKIKELLAELKCRNPRILSTYAFTEGKVAWPECCEESGYHLYPDMEFIEIVDKNNERVAEGERGEIVYTALDFRGSVVLRYKTGDISSLAYEKCESCGRTVPRIDAKIERKSEYRKFDLKKVKGSLINLNLLHELMMDNKDIDEWQIELKKKRDDPYEIDELIIYVAPKKRVNIAELKIGLKHKIIEETEITPDVIIMSRDQILEKLGMETELKEKRIIDNRPK